MTFVPSWAHDYLTIDAIFIIIIIIIRMIILIHAYRR